MTFEDRQRVKAARDQRARQRIGHMARLDATAPVFTRKRQIHAYDEAHALLAEWDRRTMHKRLKRKAA